MPLPIRLDPKRFLLGSLLILVFLILGNIVSIYAELHLKKDSALGIIPLLNFDQEANIPTLFNTLLLISASILAYFIGMWGIRKQSEPDGWRWVGIAIILAFLSVDENAGIHEQVDFILMERLDTSGAIAWPWVIPYAILAIGVAVAFLPFLLRLSWRYRILFVGSGALYCVAAIGFEMLASRHTEVHGMMTVTYAVLYTFEETFEMLAVIIANVGMLWFLRERCPGFAAQITVADADENPSSAVD